MNMTKPKISVIINTFNEERNIRNCLETVKWADEIIVVDMYSDDKTVEIAKEYTDKIYFFERMGYVEPARKYALEKAKNEWVLLVDADEITPLKLKNKLVEIMEKDLADVVYIPFNTYFFGRLMKGTGWGPLQDVHPRFFKKSFVSFSSAVHSFFNISDKARVFYITDPEYGFIHFNYIDVEHFLEKLNRYTTIEAKNMYDGIKPVPTLPNFLIKLIKEFFGRFIKKKGYADGIYGFSLSILMVAYHVSGFLKYKIMKEYNSKEPREKIISKYNEIAKKIIEEYKYEKKGGLL
jgi:glycosyltransferase involved in cell wall biosynthesis